MEDFAALMSVTYRIFALEFTLYGFTFSLWQVFAFSAVAVIPFLSFLLPSPLGMGGKAAGREWNGSGKQGDQIAAGLIEALI